jgi:hypothetical protein
MHIDGFSMWPLWIKPVMASALMLEDKSLHNHSVVSPSRVGLKSANKQRRILEEQLDQSPIEDDFKIEFNVTHDIEGEGRKLTASGHYRGQKLISEISKRAYFWHRNTENFNNYDDRTQSSVVIGGDYKLMTTTDNLCLYRFYHLKSDPKEHHNIIATRQAPLKAWNKENVQAKLDQAISGNPAEHDVFRRDVPAHIDVCNGHFLLNAQKQSAWKDVARYFDLKVLATIGHCGKHFPPDIHCLMSTGDKLLGVMQNMVSSLIIFVKHANEGHQKYLPEAQKNTCKVPFASDIANLKFGSLEYPKYYSAP